ncbi:MAG: DUF2207 domain-containing protein [Candidatus Electrothrix sp. GW3-4]|uniref:DUF2207 domain-containing protein n=1 Tax=Candidatus Electrothrix sp. GW3-4 TaxID=3126740 RepID=UPI0030CE39D8
MELIVSINQQHAFYNKGGTMKCLRQLLAVSVRAIVLAVFLLNTQTASAKSPPFYWDFINVLIDVQQNGDMLITETQKYVFTGPHTNERYRYIPLDKVDGIDQIEVYEGEEKLPFSTNIKNGQRWVKWRHELNPPESHTFVLKYRVKGGIQVHGEEDWVYVKAIFKDRSAPIESGKVTVRLPDSLSGKISSFKSFGVPAEARQVDEQTVEFVAKGTLPPGQELEVRVAVPHGVIQIPEPEQPKRDPAYWKKRAEQIQAANSHKLSWQDIWYFLLAFIKVAAPIALFFGIPMLCGKIFRGGGGGSGGSSGYTGSGYSGGGGFGGGSSGGGGGCCGGGGG